MRARKAAPRAAPSGTATVSTGRPVASATPDIQAARLVPPPLATIRRPGDARAFEDVPDHEATGLEGSPGHVCGSIGDVEIEEPARRVVSWKGTRSPRT